MQFAEQGKLKAIAVVEAERYPDLPDLPTIAESYPGVVAPSWNGLFVPAGTPQAVVDKLNEAISKIVGAPEVKQGWSKQGAVPMVMSPAAFTKYLNDDVNKWAPVIKTANIKLD